MKRLLRPIWRLASGTAARLRSGLLRRPERPEPMDATVLDDLADRRPLNVAVKGVRLWSRLARRRPPPGIAVVIVTWNTLHVTRATVRLVRRFSPDVPVLVVDNGSTDGTREWLRAERSVRRLALPFNAGHAVALDLACLLAPSAIAVCLDSDAFPIREGWLEPIAAAFADPRVVAAGSRSSRGFLHPMFLGVRTAEFRRRRLSFQTHLLAGVQAHDVVWGRNAFDTGELLSGRLDPAEQAIIPRTPNRAPGLPGMTVGDAVYHHGGVTREAGGRPSGESLRSWDRAVTALVGFDPGRDGDNARHRRGRRP